MSTSSQKLVGWQQDIWAVMKREVFPVKSTESLFNQYAEEDARFDVAGAARIRRENLRSYLHSFRAKPDLLLLAEAPGPWGCRFSGVPITSEQQLLDQSFPIDGRQSSNGDQPSKEYSAGIFWRTLLPFRQHFFVWNSVPFHPRKPGLPNSIRTPAVAELNQFSSVVLSLTAVLKPTTIVAIGRKAERTLSSVGLASVYVRHPSQGGASYFAEGIQEIMARLA